jgi:hypothetical protein
MKKSDLIRVLVVMACLAAMPVAALAQGTPPARRDTTQRPARRTLDIRATAPAPEVVTIRPREIPVFSRSLLAPALFKPSVPANTVPTTSAGPNTNRRTVVIFPGTLPPSGSVPPRTP